MGTTLELRKTWVAAAAALVVSALALPAGAAIVSTGATNPNPVGSTVLGRLDIGSSSVGTVTVNGGSTLTADQIGLGNSPSGNGKLTVTGAGSKTVVNVNLPNTGNLDIGGAGTGAVSVLSGASFAYGTATPDCILNCRMYVGNAAGSSGDLTVSGAGSSFSTPGRMIVGLGSVFSLAKDGFDYGTPGASTEGSVRIDSGGSMSAAQLTVASQGGGLARTGTEQSFGSAVVDGVGSMLTLVRNNVATGGLSLLSIANGANATGTVDIKNGGKIRIDGSTAPNDFSGVNIGSGGPIATGILRVDGAGSRLELTGGIGFINVANVAGSTGQLQITNGGQVIGTGPTGLPFASIGRNGATGSLTVSGNDSAGNASTLRLTGRSPLNDGGAFLNIGGVFNSGQAGNGTVNVLAGGRIDIDTSSLVLTNPDARPGTYVGIGQGSSGTLNISGKSALTGAPSVVNITGGTGVTPFIGIGRDGATGDMTISGGGKFLVSSSHSSTTNANGDTSQVNIGQRGDQSSNPGPGASIGTVTVTGAGSELAVNGTADRYINVGIGSGAVGILNVLAGAVAKSLTMLVGTGSGASGSVNVNGGRIELGGLLTSGAAAGTGGSFSVGRSGGTGTANFSNGAVLNLSSPTAGTSVNAGGTGPAPGGVGTINVTGGSAINLSGPGSIVRVGGQGDSTIAGIGTMNVIGAGSSVNVTGSGGRVLVGATANTVGTLTVGVGASVSASSAIGIAHDGTANTGGIGTLVVNGTVTAPSIVNGSAGIIGGSGHLVGSVTNHGIINPGNSPGRLTIDGAFDSADGKIVLEIKRLSDGSYIFDELVFADPAHTTIGKAKIEFDFLGDTNPKDFLSSGLFNLGTFIKQVDLSGIVSAVQSAQLINWFGAAEFGAQADAYHFNTFSFSPTAGAQFGVTANVPVPATLPLVGLALMALVGVRKRKV